jgi:hypothetical protein
MTPEWGSRAADVPPETQFLLLMLGEAGPYVAMLPLLDSGQFRATLRPASFPARFWLLHLRAFGFTAGDRVSPSFPIFKNSGLSSYFLKKEFSKTRLDRIFYLGGRGGGPL